MTSLMSSDAALNHKSEVVECNKQTRGWKGNFQSSLPSCSTFCHFISLCCTFLLSRVAIANHFRYYCWHLLITCNYATPIFQITPAPIPVSRVTTNHRFVKIYYTSQNIIFSRCTSVIIWTKNTEWRLESLHKSCHQNVSSCLKFISIENS